MNQKIGMRRHKKELRDDNYIKRRMKCNYEEADMDKEQKRLIEKNKKSAIVSFIILGEILLNSIVSFFGNSGREHMTIACLISIAIVANAIGYIVFKASVQYKRFCLYSGSFAYLVLMFTSFQRSPYIYVYVIPLMLLALFYGDKKFIYGGMITGNITNIGFGIYVMYKSNFEAGIVRQNLIQIIILVLISLLIVMYVRVQSKHIAEDTAELEEKMAYQQRVDRKSVL